MPNLPAAQPRASYAHPAAPHLGWPEQLIAAQALLHQVEAVDVQLHLALQYRQYSAVRARQYRRAPIGARGQRRSRGRNSNSSDTLIPEFRQACCLHTASPSSYSALWHSTPHAPCRRPAGAAARRSGGRPSGQGRKQYLAPGKRPPLAPHLAAGCAPPGPQGQPPAAGASPAAHRWLRQRRTCHREGQRSKVCACEQQPHLA